MAGVTLAMFWMAMGRFSHEWANFEFKLCCNITFHTSWVRWFHVLVSLALVSERFSAI
jgi:hypothetical protein